MSQFMEPFTWHRYSKSLKKAILRPHNVGVITEEEAQMSEMRLASASAGRLRDGNLVKMYLLVDEDDGLIADAKFQAYGDSALIGAAQIMCGLILRKNYDQAGHMSAEFIDRHARDSSDQPAFPDATFSHLNLVISAVSDAVEQCQDIPFADDYVPPVPFEDQESGEPQYPDFLNLSDEQKGAVLDEVIARDIRPYVELDAGDVKVTKIEGYKITITYEGSCTSCYSATGATLNAIQSRLRSKVHASITVVPDPSTLTFEPSA